MAKPYFRQVPNFEYVSRDKDKQHISEYVQVKNLFKRGKLREDIFGNLAFFEKYSIVGDERPDNVAYKFYGEETLDWVVLLSNNILNIQSEWPMTQRVLDKFLLEKYGSYENLYSGIHHYETTEIKNSLGITVLQSGLTISPTWNTNGNFTSYFNDKIFNLYAGDGISSSTRVVVETFKPIPLLKVGDPITIENFQDNAYNGTFIVTEILNTIELSNNQFAVFSFAFQLPSAPDNPDPLGTMFTAFTVTYNESSYKIVLYSGDGVTPSTTVIVNAIEGINGLSVGDTIIIENVTESVYNGTFTVTSILEENEETGSIISFTYELPETPTIAYPQTPAIQDIRIYGSVSEKFTLDKKSSTNLTADGEVIEIPSSSYYYEYYDSNLESSVQIPSTSFIREVTNYEYELLVEEKKRNIYVLKPRYLNVAFNDMDDIMPYKRGSTQYVNATLKRGDNIRLYQ